ncbi:hypothetical protein M3Y94_00251600 [Aphelenchoides besseyi]|nr:hypothetical protein M3Y94_00251600 [Aphelenchoides besseyi]KAI6236248.1 hypothetical protein M3Y95_00137300 [Aphelenchoides besseyi]
MRVFILVQLILLHLASTTVFAQNNTAAIASSATFNGFPKWALPGVVLALKNVYKSLNTNVQLKAQQLIDDNTLTVNQLINKLGSSVDAMPTDQQSKIRDLLTEAEEERRQSAVEVEDTQLSDNAKTVYSKLVDVFTTLSDSLSTQCAKAQAAISSASEKDLVSIGVPANFKNVNCSKLSSILLN